MDPQFVQYGMYLSIGAAVFLAIEAAYLSVSRRMSYTRQVNSRLKTLDEAETQADVLVLLRRARGLSSDGRFVLPLIWFNRLALQSGVPSGVLKVGMGVAISVGVFVAFLVYLRLGLPVAILSFVGCAGVLPVLVLMMRRRKRLRDFETQLPDAIDIMVRGLRAGHPLPVSIAMVGREMPDPIGSEFGMTADELTYGLDLEASMSNLSARVGQEDLTLLVLAITIQAQTGGNLSEILSNLVKVLRARTKMRRKIKSVSAEGRAAAMILSALPFLVFGAIFISSPNFYGGIWHEPVVPKVLGMAIGWMLIGNIIMYRMVNFRI